MANVSHATLTGADLHEPKGVSSATAGTVYVANGGGSGAWTAPSSAFAFTGMIADFGTPVAPIGWLECTGSAISRITFSDLFNVLTIQQTGTRSSGSNVISGLPDTNNMRVGYFVGGTGIVHPSTIISINGPTAITISTNATSNGTATVIVSPWALGDGTSTFNIPEVSTSGRYRRSRTSSTIMGAYQATSIDPHTHTMNFTSGSENANHSHTGTTNSDNVDHFHTGVTGFENQAHAHDFSGNTAGQSQGHTHQVSNLFSSSNFTAAGGNPPGGFGFTGNTSDVSNDHTHGFSGTTNTENAGHSHNFTTSGVNTFHQHTFSTATESVVHQHNISGTTASTGTGDNRPVTVIVITCIKI